MQNNNVICKFKNLEEEIKNLKALIQDLGDQGGQFSFYTVPEGGIPPSDLASDTKKFTLSVLGHVNPLYTSNATSEDMDAAKSWIYNNIPGEWLNLWSSSSFTFTFELIGTSKAKVTFSTLKNKSQIDLSVMCQVNISGNTITVSDYTIDTNVTHYDDAVLGSLFKKLLEDMPEEIISPLCTGTASGGSVPITPTP